MNDEYKHVQPDEYGEYDWSWQDNPDDEMESLPKKKDYNDIKKFQPYELTQCVSYEMAIRNPCYKEEVDFVMESYRNNQESIDAFIENHHLKRPPDNIDKEAIQFHYRNKEKYYQAPAEARRYFYKDDKKYYRSKANFDDQRSFTKLLMLIENIETIPFNYTDSYIEREEIDIYGEDFYNLLHKIMKSFHYNKQKEKRMQKPIMHKKPKFLFSRLTEDSHDIIKNFNSGKQTNKPSIVFDKSNSTIEFVNIEEHKGCSIISKYTRKQLRGARSLTEEDVSIMQKDTSVFFEHFDRYKKGNSISQAYLNKIGSEISIVEKFQRPKLRFHSYMKKNITAKIDISRPEKEIIEYIKYLKNILKDNNYLSIDEFIKSSTEASLEDVAIVKGKAAKDVEKETYLYNAEKYSEMFFVWDYINAQVRNYINYNEVLQKNLEIKIHIINRNTKQDHTFNKTSQIQEAKKYFIDKKKSLDIKQLCMKENTIHNIGLKGKTIFDRYNLIKEFLEKEKYREIMNDNRN